MSGPVRPITLAFAVLLLVAWFVAFVVAFGFHEPPHGRPVPSCEEDQVIVGTGNFAHGYWDAYACAFPSEVQ